MKNKKFVIFINKKIIITIWYKKLFFYNLYFYIFITILYHKNATIEKLSIFMVLCDHFYFLKINVIIPFYGNNLKYFQNL